MGNVLNTTTSAGTGNGSEIKVNIEKLDRNIEDMNSLCDLRAMITCPAIRING